MHKGQMTPKEIVEKLDERIIGQKSAKRAVAIAIRNRWRRLQLSKEISSQITPKNILMIGPTGVGKTEISRKLSLIVNSPFVKVEATNFSEIGYVGRTVDTIIEDLIEASMKMVREKLVKKVQSHALHNAQERILDEILSVSHNKENESIREFFRKKILEGKLDNKKITISLPCKTMKKEDYSDTSKMLKQLQGIKEEFFGKKMTQRCISIKEALKLLQEAEIDALINEDEIISEAISKAEESGIVFIDEIDKITGSNDRNTDVSREGVQRDLISIIEGSSVQTKYGIVKTDHILFIASGAFHMSKPSDLLPELQGRFPLKVQLESLNKNHLECILHSIIKHQYEPMLAVDGIKVNFPEEGVKLLAEIAEKSNTNLENIGARRLYEIMERLLEEISFDIPESTEKILNISREYIEQSLSYLLSHGDYNQLVL